MNQRVDFDYSVDDADRLLDRLEAVAVSDTHDDVFWHQALDGLRTLTDCHSTSLIIPVQGEWTEVHRSGSISTPLESLPISASGFPSGADFLDQGPKQAWGAVPVCDQSHDQGLIVLCFRPAISYEGWLRIRTIAIAFAEICWLRGQKRLERLAGHATRCLRLTTARFADCASIEALQAALVDSLQAFMGADRCSLVAFRERPQLIACSGVREIDARSPTVQAIINVAAEVRQHAKPIVVAGVHQETPKGNGSDTDSLLLESRLAVPWNSADATSPDFVLVLEWLRKRDMLEHLQTASDWMPVVQSLWNQQLHWLHVPPGHRQRAVRQSTSATLQPTKQYRRLAVATIGLVLLAWLLFHPSPMRITADAHLEPTAIRSIHATADGFIDEVLVDEESRVTQGQVLAKLRSPSLDFQIEDTLGKLRTMAEKRNGLNVSINQLVNNATDATSTQTKLTSELLILDAQEKHAQETLAFLRKEQERLSITSPIEGVVVASELRQELLRRPVRRGDALFRIAAMDGEWRLHIQIADRDTKYVSQSYDRDHDRVDFVFDSLPSEVFPAYVRHMSPMSENILGSGSYQRAFASVDREIAKRVHMGATAHVTFHCGEQPAWFVWSRPLVEFLQRRTRFFSRSYDAANRSDDGQQ